MNRCQIQKKLSAYLDGQLNEQQKMQIVSHLKECKTCAAELAQLEALKERLKTWQAAPVNPGFNAAVTDKIVSWELGKGEVKMKRKTWAILVPSGALAGILVFLFVGMFAHTQGQFELAKNVMQRSKVSREVARYVPQKPDGKFYINQGIGGTESASVYPQARISEADQYVSNWQTRGGTENLSSAVAEREEVRGYSDGVMNKAIQSPAAMSLPLENYSGQGTVIVVEPGLPATGQGEKIIRTGDVTIEVENGKETYKKVSDLCQELGGFLASSNFYRDNEGREAGTITLRIPKDKFTVALERLSALGKVEDINTDSKDVSQEYANLNSQLDAAMVVYKKMLEALQKRQVTIPEAMRLESEITPVLKRVQDLKNKIEALNNSISFTTVNVNFYEARASLKALKESSRFIRESILTSGIKAVQFFAKAIPVVIVLGIVLVLLLGAVVLVKKWIIRFFKHE